MKQLRISFAALMVLLVNGCVGCFAQAPSIHESQLPAQPPDASSTLVKSPVVVYDMSDRYRKGLNREDFLLEVDNHSLPIDFFRNQETAASIVFLVDTSASMKSKLGETSRYSFLPAAAARFFRLSHTGNEYLVASFGLEPRIRLDWTAAADEAMKALTTLANEKPQGLTNVRDACFFGIAQALRGNKTKKVLVLFSDGQDTSNDSRVKSVNAKVLSRELLENNIQIYIVNLASFQDGSALSLIGEELLNSLVKPTGGSVFFPRNIAELNRSLEHLALTLHAQYEIGFYPPPTIEQKRRYKIKIRLAPQAMEKYKLKGMLIRHREGFSVAAIARSP